MPLLIMPAYFSMGYLSFMLAHILLDQYSERLKGAKLVAVPVIAAFVMVMWDLVIDPVDSTLAGQWVWPNGGDYFDVPISNYLGWYLTVYLIFQLFALFLHFSKADGNPSPMACGRTFWLQVPIVYGVHALTWVGYMVSASGLYENGYVYVSMALICVFTMLFVGVLTLFKVLSRGEWPKTCAQVDESR